MSLKGDNKTEIQDKFFESTKNEKLGEKIKKYRKASGMTQEALAEELDLSVHAVRKYEQNKREPNFKTLKKIASILNIPLGEIIGEEGRKQLRKVQETINHFYSDIDKESFEVFCNYVDITFPEILDDLLPKDIKTLYIKVNDYVEYSLIKLNSETESKEGEPDGTPTED